MRRLAAVQAVVFDCDSTLSGIEGIDELGSGMREQIEALTNAAMRGDLPLEAVYGRRLDLIRPAHARVAGLARQYVERLVPDARSVVRALQACDVTVRIMSGGLLPAVLAVADALGVARRDVAAVDVYFDAEGVYAGFDERSPLARSGGKRELLADWRAELCAGAACRTMMVGDGATDLEAAAVADVFVAYAGAVARAEVMAGADVVIRTASLAPVVPLALGGVPPAHAPARDVFELGMSLLDEEYRTRLSDFRS